MLLHKKGNIINVQVEVNNLTCHFTDQIVKKQIFSFYDPEVQVSDRLLVLIYSLHGGELVYVDSVSVLASVQH